MLLLVGLGGVLPGTGIIPKILTPSFRGVKSKNFFLQHSHKIYTKVSPDVMFECTLLHIAFFYLKGRIICSKINSQHRAEPTLNNTADVELCSADFLPSMSHLSFKCQSSNSRHLPVAQTRGERSMSQCVKRHTENPNTSGVNCMKLSEYSFF